MKSNMNKKTKTAATALCMGLLLMPGRLCAAEADSTIVSGGSIDNVVVTGTRQATDVRFLPMNVTVVSRSQLTENFQQSVLPTLTQEVPGLFISSRGVMGYGVSGGGSGSFNLRGLSGGSRVLVLIDGHPQYNGV